MQGPPTPTCHWWACDCHRPGAKDEPKMQTWDNMNEAALLHGVCASCLPSHWRVCELLTFTLACVRAAYLHTAHGARAWHRLPQTRIGSSPRAHAVPVPAIY